MTRHHLNLELARYKQPATHLTLSSFGSLLAALYFFALIGRFETGADSLMFQRYSGIFAIALTVGLCVTTIHAAVIYARLICADYIGNRRIQQYSYPHGRRPLFLAKNTAYAIATASAAIIGFTAATVTFLVTETLASISANAQPPNMLAILAGVLAAVLLTVSISLAAGIIGVARQSTITVIVTAIIGVALAGNGIAASLTGATWITTVIGIAATICAALIVWGQAKRIVSDEVL